MQDDEQERRNRSYVTAASQPRDDPVPVHHDAPFDVFVAAGAGNLLVGRKHQLRGQWVPCDLEPREAVLAIRAARGSARLPETVDRLPPATGLASWLRRDLATNFTEQLVPWSCVTYMYPDNEMNRFVHPALDDEGAASDTTDIFAPGRQYNVGLRVVPGDASLQHCVEYVEDFVIALRCMSDPGNYFKLLTLLRAGFVALHNGGDNLDVLAKRSDLRPQPRSSLASSLMKPMQRMVSLKKRRFEADGFSLDLAYLTPKIIACGFPALPTDHDYNFRNHMYDVQNFLDKKHHGNYHVFNLCAERAYPPSSFGGKFSRFPWDDHEAPPLHLLLEFVKTADAAVSSGKTVVVHCKAGKGRTGVALVALSFYVRARATSEARTSLAELTIEDDEREYGKARSHDGVGVSIASQQRFLRYFERCVKEVGSELPLLRPITLSSCTIHTTPWIDLQGGCRPFIQLRVRHPRHHSVPLERSEWVKTKAHGVPGVCDVAAHTCSTSVDDGNLLTIFDSRVYERETMQRGLTQYIAEPTIVLPLGGTLVAEEVYFVLFDAAEGGGKHAEYMCSGWLHTSFMDGVSGVTTLHRHEIDGANKGSGKQFFDENFSMAFHFTPMPPQARKSHRDYSWVRQSRSPEPVVPVAEFSPASPAYTP